MWACWMVFLLCQPIDPLILSFRLPRSIYYIFTSYHSYGLVGHHSCHVNPLSLTLYSLGFLDPCTSSLPLIVHMGLLPYSLGFVDLFTTSLPLLILMGLLAITPTMSAHWVYHFIPWTFSAHLFILYLSLLPWVYCLILWAFSAHLLHLYLLSLLWACWPLLLPCQPN